MARRLRRVEVATYEEDASEGDAPASQISYSFGTKADSVSATWPFSLSVVRGTRDRLLLVVRGHAAETGPPIIEAKRLVTFAPGQGLFLSLHLAEGCMDRVCTSLDTTCDPAEGCLETPEAQTTFEADPDPRQASMDSGVDGSSSSGGGEGQDAGVSGDAASAARDAEAADTGTADSSEECTSGACLPGGGCVVGVEGWYCDCDDGYLGTGTRACEPATYCPEDACGLHGRCIDQPAWYCECDVGYDGESCEIDTCDSLNCARGERCRRRDSGPTCEACPNGYFGSTCEQDICAPENDPCEHGGRCSRLAGGQASCDCAGTGYEGPHCENVDICSLCVHDEYPCVTPEPQLDPPAYLCRGQQVEWPIAGTWTGAAVAPRYDTDTHTGVVIDEVTGLWWQRYLPGTASSTESAYAGCGEQTRCYRAEAFNYCEQLNLAGHDDWRIPSAVELQSIVDYTRADPAIDPMLFPDVPSVLPYFTSATIDPEPDIFVAVSFQRGSTTRVYDNFGTLVRCVRSVPLMQPGQTPGNRYLVDAENNSVRDDRTGLVWQRVLGSGTYRPSSGAAHCASLGQGYRMPTIAELLSLSDAVNGVDEAVLPPAPDLSQSTFYSSTPVADLPDYYWILSAGDDGGYLDTTVSYAVSARCVR